MTQSEAQRASRLGALLGVLIAVLLVAALSGCTGHTVYEAAVGVNATKHMPWAINGADGGFAGPRDTFRFSVRRESANGRTFCGWNHVSHLSAGPPFNDKGEDWLDMVECGVRLTSRDF